ncbi:MAG: hypothetical protein Q8O40_07825 [Chloroflexota bacterium]|nr:hypothetical protein [Chloroflexota bacterium]
MPEYERDVSTLSKKYRNAQKNLKAVERLLTAGKKESLQAVKVSGFGSRSVWKARAISEDITRGKSGGFRVWWIEVGDCFYLVHVYTHHDNRDEQEVRREVSRRLSLSGQ